MIVAVNSRASGPWGTKSLNAVIVKVTSVFGMTFWNSVGVSVGLGTPGSGTMPNDDGVTALMKSAVE